jgi:hypothetical protein
MAKVRILVRPSGLINGVEWPEVGQTIDLPDAVADGMVKVGDVERVAAKKAAPEKKVEKATAPEAKVEKRTEKKS